MPSVTAGGGFGEGAGGSLVVLDRGEGVNGELVLRTDGSDLEVIANGVFLMDTRLTVSERLMVSATLARVRPGARLLVGGLGVGASLVHERNAGLYAVPALLVAARRLAPGGSCVYWSASPSDAFGGRLRQVYADIERVDVGRFDVGRADASPDVLYACRRPLVSLPGDR